MNELVNQLTGWIDFLEKTRTENHDDFFSPIAEGKWSKAAIISHITFWDKFFFNERLPLMLEGGSLHGITADQVEDMNKKAENYAHSGKSLSELIEESIEQRKQIVAALQDQDLTIRYTNKGKEYTIEDYVKGEVDHDQHHLKQLVK